MRAYFGRQYCTFFVPLQLGLSSNKRNNYDRLQLIHVHEATLKKVSSLAGGPNYGHSGGRKIFFFPFFFLFFLEGGGGKKMTEIFDGGKKQRYQSAQNFGRWTGNKLFLGWPESSLFDFLE